MGIASKNNKKPSPGVQTPLGLVFSPINANTK